MSLAQRLAAYPERVMREVVLVETLSAQPPARGVQLIDELLASARHDRTPENLTAITALAGALERIPYESASALYEAAKAAGLPDVARLFFAVPIKEGQAEPEQRVPGSPRKLTLGE